MTPPRDQQSVEEIIQKAVTALNPRTDGERVTAYNVVKAAIDELKDKFRPTIRRIQDIALKIGSRGGETQDALDLIESRLTAHDEALPGDWTVVPVDTSQPTGMCFIRTREGGKLRFYLRYEQAVAVAAAHNSALRVLVDALRKAQRELIEVQPHIPQSCYPGHEKFIDAHLDVAREAIDKALQPYSGQKELQRHPSIKMDVMGWKVIDTNGLETPRYSGMTLHGATDVLMRMEAELSAQSRATEQKEKHASD